MNNFEFFNFRLRLSEACADLLHNYRNRMDNEKSWLGQMSSKVNAMVSKRDLQAAIVIRLNHCL